MINDLKKSNFISVVAYLHQDVPNLPEFYCTIHGVLAQNFQNFEIIFVDDASTDNPLEKLTEIKQELGSLSVIRMSYFQGLEKAMCAGLDLAIGDFVYEFDTIMINYQPEIIMDLYQQAVQDIDIIVASEKNSEKFLSGCFYRIFNKYAKIQYKIGTERFRILSRRAINRIMTLNCSLPYRKFAYSASGLKMFRIEYEKINHQKISNVQDGRFNLAINNLIFFTDFFYKWSLRLSVMAIIGTVATFIYAVLTFFWHRPIRGWTTTMLVLSCAFMGVFLLLTATIKYLDVLVKLSFNKQKYLIQEISKLN